VSRGPAMRLHGIEALQREAEHRPIMPMCSAKIRRQPRAQSLQYSCSLLPLRADRRISCSCPPAGQREHVSIFDWMAGAVWRSQSSCDCLMRAGWCEATTVAHCSAHESLACCSVSCAGTLCVVIDSHPQCEADSSTSAYAPRCILVLRALCRRDRPS
jgi:hypothetical protein